MKSGYKVFLIMTSLLFIYSNQAVGLVDQVTINYSGTIVISPCIISTPTINLEFGDIPASDLATSGTTSDWKTARIQLTDCSSVNQLIMTVNFTPDPNDIRYMASTGTAKHVAVENSSDLLDVNHILNGRRTIVPLLGAKSYSEPFRFRIRNDGTGAATPGTVVSAMTITYEFK